MASKCASLYQMTASERRFAAIASQRFSSFIGGRISLLDTPTGVLKARGR
jgi:hypothetical protein